MMRFDHVISAGTRERPANFLELDRSMKRFFSLLMTSLLALLLAACGGGGGSAGTISGSGSAVTIPFQVQAPDGQITFLFGQSVSYNIYGGTPPYRAVSSTSGIVAEVTGSTIKLSGAESAIGTVITNSGDVNVYDSGGSTPVKLSVFISSGYNLTLAAPSSLTMSSGSTRSFTFSGGVAPFQVFSTNPLVADASVSGNTISIIATGSTGFASIQLKDAADSTEFVSVDVVSTATVTGFFTTAPSDVTIQGGNTRTFTVGGGTPPYTAASSNTGVVQASISGSTLSLSAQGKGLATVNLVDAVGTPLAVSVNVEQSASSLAANIDLSTSTASIKSAGEEAVITAVVKSASNVGVAGQEVIFSASSGNLLAPTAQTDSSGVATVRLSPGSDKSLRSITITATAGAASKTVNVAVVGTSISVTGSTALQLGSSSSTTYSLRALDSSGNPVASVPMTVASALGNGVTPSAVTTDSNGNATVRFTPTRAGADKLTVSGLGTTGSLDIAVSSVNFTVQSPVANSSVNVGANQTVVVRYLNGGVGVAGQTVNFSTTRGSLIPATGIAVTDVNGDASIQITSGSAGPGTVTAQLPAVAPAIQPLGEVTLPLTFVAINPTAIQLQINPGAIAPNPSGQTNQTTVEATVRDATGNAVANRQVNFTIVADQSNGSLQSGTALTDSNGKARTNFISGPLSTPNNGVVIRADVVGTALTSNANLTVSGNALFITIGFGNTIDNLDPTTYSKPFSVYVTDANGVAVGNQVVTLSVIPDRYRKGRLAWNDPVWSFATGSPTASCLNEDTNRNGILDTGEDLSGNGLLTPGNVVVAVPGSVTTGIDGRAVFSLQYGEQFVPWIDAVLIARATVSGTESRRELPFSLSGLASDFDSETVPPAGVRSPFGVSAVCNDSN